MEEDLALVSDLTARAEGPNTPYPLGQHEAAGGRVSIFRGPADQGWPLLEQPTTVTVGLVPFTVEADESFAATVQTLLLQLDAALVTLQRGAAKVSGVGRKILVVPAILVPELGLSAAQWANIWRTTLSGPRWNRVFSEAWLAVEPAVEGESGFREFMAALDADSKTGGSFAVQRPLHFPLPPPPPPGAARAGSGRHPVGHEEPGDVPGRPGPHSHVVR